MRQNAKKICSVLFSATVVAISGLAHAQQDFDREKAANAIAASEAFKDCHIGINNWDACNWAIYTGRWNSIAAYWGSPAVHPEPDSLKGNPVGYWLYKEKAYLQLSPAEILILSEKGRTASKDWKHVTAPGREADSPQSTFERWDVPLATKKFAAITNVVRGRRMEIQFAEVHYRWVYSLTPLGTELFKNERIPSTGRNVGGSIAPAALTGIDLNKTYDAKTLAIDELCQVAFMDGSKNISDSWRNISITVDNHLVKLRQKLERDPSDPVHFKTVHSFGYKFVR